MIILYALLGLLVGILINLCADQLPRWERLRRAPFCPECEQTRPWWAWSGSLAYLRLKPHCPHCGTRIPWRQPLVEVGTALLFAFLWQRYAQSELLIPYTLYSAIFVLVLVIDLEHKLILRVVMYPAWVVAIVASFFYGDPYSYRLALLGGLIGFVILWIFYLFGLLFVKIISQRRGKPLNTVAFGYGDVRLGVFMGLVLGFPLVFQAIFVAVLLGGLGGLIYWFVKAVILRDYSRYTPIPYGPYLIIGAMFVLFFGQPPLPGVF